VKSDHVIKNAFAHFITTMAAKVWCLIIDHELKPRGDLSSITLKHNIEDLKLDLQEKESIALPPSELQVWRCIEPETNFNDEDPETLEKQVYEAFSNNKVKRLSPRRTIAELNLMDGETLFVQVPGAFTFLYSIASF